MTERKHPRRAFTVLERMSGTWARAEVDAIWSHCNSDRPLPQSHNQKFLAVPWWFPERLVDIAMHAAYPAITKKLFHWDVVYDVLKFPDGTLDWDDVLRKVEESRAKRRDAKRALYTHVRVWLLAWGEVQLRRIQSFYLREQIYFEPDEPSRFAMPGRVSESRVSLALGDGVDFDWKIIRTAREPEDKFGPELLR